MIGGSLGAICRYAINLISERFWGGNFPYATLIANLVGCLLIGLAFGLTAKLNLMNHSARLFFITGFLGALTTFSSYAFETVAAANAGSYSVVLTNIFANNVFGLALVLFGMWAIRAIF